MSLRQVVLDTETTGIDFRKGNRIIEIGCVEVIKRRLTGRHYHVYINPEFEVEQGALEVHGLTNAFLSDKPKFAEIVDEFYQFIKGAELIIHNAAFDIGFIDNEFSLLRQNKYGATADFCEITDSLMLARAKHPGQKNSLDALCKRYGVDNSHRELHGALLDAEILADVYLLMTGGQTAFDLAVAATESTEADVKQITQTDNQRCLIELPVITAQADEVEAHQKKLQVIDKASGGGCVWLKA